MQVIVVPGIVCCKIQDPAPDLNYSCTWSLSRYVSVEYDQTRYLCAFSIDGGQNSLGCAAQKGTEVVVLLLLNRTCVSKSLYGF